MGMNNNMNMNNPMMMNMMMQMMNQNNNNNMMGMNNNMNMNNPMMMNMMNGQNQNNAINMPNQQIQQNGGNSGNINLIFSKDLSNYNIVTNYNESLGAVISKYIALTNDNNINMYICNGKRLSESLTVGESNLTEGCLINVVPTQNILGAKKKK